MKKKFLHFDIKKKLMLQGAAVFTCTVLFLLILFSLLESINSVEAAIPLSGETLINNDDGTLQQKTDIGMDEKGRMVMVWTSMNHPLDSGSDGIFYRRFDQLGVAMDSNDVLVNTTTAGDQSEGAVAVDRDGNFVVVWSGVGGDSNPGIFIQAFKNDNGTISALGSETRVSDTIDTYSEPTIAIDYDGFTNGSTSSFVVVWTTHNGSDADVYHRLYTVDFANDIAPSASGTENLVNTYIVGDQQYPDVAMNNRGEYMIAWEGPGDGATGIWYQFYLNDGSLIGSNTLVNTASAGNKLSVAAAKSSVATIETTGERSFIVAYEGIFNTDGSPEEGIGVRHITCTDADINNGIYTDITCIKNTVELIANTSTDGSQIEPDVSADALGNYTVVWEDSIADGHQEGIVGQSYTANGKRIGSNFVVNTSVNGNQTNPSIALDTDGFYAVTFTNDFSNRNYFQQYVSEIFKVQSESMPHTSSIDNQAKVRTAIAPNGNHVQVWKDYSDQSIRFTLRTFDNNAVAIAENVRVDDNASTSSDNPVVSFFQDTVGDGAGKFIIAWESNSSGNLDIFYQIYDAGGNPEGGIQQANLDATGDQTYPALAAGYYYTNGTGDGPAITEFDLGWIDNNDSTIKSAYYNNGFTYASFGSCSSCNFLNVALHTSNNRAVYTWDSDSGGFQQVFVQQLVSGSVSGSTSQINAEAFNQTGSDVAFIDEDEFVVVYSKSPELSSGRILGIHFNFIEGSTPIIAAGPFNVSGYRQSTGPQAYPRISSDTAHNTLLVVWSDFPIVSDEDFIFGQFFTFSSNSLSTYGPTFRINSTEDGQQTLPAVGLNASGEAVVAWEGTIDQPLLSDSNSVVTQLLESRLIAQAAEDFAPTVQQEIVAGIQFLEVPATISFPAVAVNTEDSTTQAVSIRDPDFGGDIKYIEVQDLMGVDFTLTIQASDFVSQEDGKVYITNTGHFKVRNWDQDETSTDSGCSSDPDLCLQTLNSSESTTALQLSPETQDFVFVDTQKVLAEKRNTQNNEIGKWRIFPEFQITVPPLIPAGQHEAQITFTLT